MTTLSATTRISRSPNLVPAELDDEVVLMTMDEGKYFGLKGTARRIWELLESPCSLAELCQQLREHYQAPAERIDADVMTFVGQLAEQGLIQLS